MITCIIFGLIFSAAGISFITGHGLKYVPGWQVMSEREKQNIRIEALCRNIGTALLAGGLVLILGSYWSAILRYGVVIWFALCIVDLIYIERSGKYVISDSK